MKPLLTPNGPVVLLPGPKGRYVLVRSNPFKSCARAHIAETLNSTLDRETWEAFQEEVATRCSAFPQSPVFVRCGSANGRDRWIDMVGPDGDKFIKLNGGGWSIEDSCTVPFFRGDGMASLPTPFGGASLKQFEQYANFSHSDWLMVWPWIGYCMRGETWENAEYPDAAHGPFLQLVITGQRHSGKTTAIRVSGVHRRSVHIQGDRRVAKEEGRSRGPSLGPVPPGERQ